MCTHLSAYTIFLKDKQDATGSVDGFAMPGRCSIRTHGGVGVGVLCLGDFFTKSPFTLCWLRKRYRGL